MAQLPLFGRSPREEAVLACSSLATGTGVVRKHTTIGTGRMTLSLCVLLPRLWLLAVPRRLQGFAASTATVSSWPLRQRRTQFALARL